jgi:HEAT repeat protein
MSRTVVPLGLFVALALTAPIAAAQTAEIQEQIEKGMKKDKKPRAPEKSQFFALFALPVDPQIAEDEQLLRDGKVASDGPALVKFMSTHIPTDQDRARLDPLITKLGDKSFKVRDLAAKELGKEGPLVLAQLRPLLNGGDLEMVRRAQSIIDEIERRFTSAQTAAAVRLLRDRKPKGAVPVLLNYLPYAANDLIEDEVVTSVLMLTIEEKKIDPALTAALRDPNVARRAAAALVLGREGTAADRTAVRQLLSDKEAVVRFRAAQGLLCGRDKEGVPVLIALLADGPFRYAELAEDLLQRLAGDDSPQTGLTDNAAVRAKGQEVWKQWWQARAAKLDLAKNDTDLFFADTQKRSRDVTRQFLTSILKTDFKMFQKSTDVPFNFANFMSFSTREELDTFFKMAFEDKKGELERQGAAFKVGKVVTVGEYVKKSRPQDRDYLMKMPAIQTRIVHVILISGNGGSREESGGIVVRVHGPRVRVIGLVIGNRNEP